MTTAKCLLIALSLMLIAGCVIRDDGGGRGYYGDRGDFHDEGHGGEHARNNFQR